MSSLLEVPLFVVVLLLSFYFWFFLAVLVSLLAAVKMVAAVVLAVAVLAGMRERERENLTVWYYGFVYILFCSLLTRVGGIP